MAGNDLLSLFLYSDTDFYESFPENEKKSAEGRAGSRVCHFPGRSLGLSWPTSVLVIYKRQLLAARWEVSRKTASANHFFFPFIKSWAGGNCGDLKMESALIR